MDLLINDRLQFPDEHKNLLRAQVSLTEAQERTDKQLSQWAQKIAQTQKERYEAQKHTDERLNALIAVVDDLVRREPKRPQ